MDIDSMLRRDDLVTRNFLAGLLSIMLGATCFAQWPTSYTTPKTISSGTGVRAGDVMAVEDGGVVTAFDQIVNGVHTPKSTHFNSYGVLQPVEFSPFNTGQPISKFTLLPAPSALFGLAVQYTQNTSVDQDFIFTYRAYLADGGEMPYTGSDFWTAFSEPWIAEDPQLSNGQLAAGFYNPWNSQFGLMSLSTGLADPLIQLNPGESIEEPSLLVYGASHILACYTRVAPQQNTQTAVWLTSLNIAGSVSSLTPEVQADDELGEFQSHPQLVKLGDNAMLTWIAKRDGQSKLRAEVVDFYGTAVTSAHDTIANVIDYQAIPTSLGLPVFAAVQQNTAVYPPVNTLIGGLINPSNGGTLSIPVASAPGLKLKTLQQEANGDFSLVYSVPEAGTNLLKVRRISGVSAATLWETIVADLGMASDEVIKQHPNTWVSSNSSNVLFILARHDEANSANSSYQLVRLQADGAMGGN